MYPKKAKEEYTPVPFRFPERELTHNEECAKTGQRSYTGRHTLSWQVLAREIKR